jgi:hypothetical protein
VLDSEDVSAEDDALDSEDADGLRVSGSVVSAVSTGVAAVSTGVVATSAGVTCSVVVVWTGSASVDWVVDDEAASGDRVAAFSAFVDSVEVVSRFSARALARGDLPFVSAPFVAALAVLPGKAWAASSVKTPVSVAEPANSQRLQRFSRLRAASRERLVGLFGEVFMGTYSTP